MLSFFDVLPTQVPRGIYPLHALFNDNIGSDVHGLGAPHSQFNICYDQATVTLSITLPAKLYILHYNVTTTCGKNILNATLMRACTTETRIATVVGG